MSFSLRSLAKLQPGRSQLAVTPGLLLGGQLHPPCSCPTSMLNHSVVFLRSVCSATICSNYLNFSALPTPPTTSLSTSQSSLRNTPNAAPLNQHAGWPTSMRPTSSTLPVTLASSSTCGRNPSPSPSQETVSSEHPLSFISHVIPDTPISIFNGSSLFHIKRKPPSGSPQSPLYLFPPLSQPPS